MTTIIAKRYKFVDGVLVEKQCSKCEKWKSINEFTKDRRKKYGLGSWCTACMSKSGADWIARNPEKHRANSRNYARKNPVSVSQEYRRTHKLKEKYGLTVAEYEKMSRDQNGVCAICGGSNNGKRLVVDHDHITGKVRRLLCHNCNTAIGHAKEDIGILEKIIGYLKSFK